MSETHWPRVKEILDNALKRWEAERGREAKMRVVHEGLVGWGTKEELAASNSYDLQFIEPEKVGNGRARETNLLKILTRNIGGYRRMPSGGPYLSPAEIEEIAEWIDGGMPD